MYTTLFCQVTLVIDMILLGVNLECDRWACRYPDKAYVMQHLDYQNISNSCNSFKKKPQQYLRFRWASPFGRSARGLH
jgi:hypothetical protein